MGMIGIDIKISDLNPLRWAQADRLDYNYATSGFRDTLYSVNSNSFKYVQKYALNDAVRIQICSYGQLTLNLTITVEKRNLADEVIGTYTATEKTGTFNNGDLRVWEFEHTLDTSGMFYFYMKVDHRDDPEHGETIYFVSEPIMVDSSFNCLPKIVYKDSQNYPQYDLYFATGIKFQLRLEIGANLFPHVDLVNYSDNVQNFATLHKTFYDKMDIFTTSVLPVWLARKFKFALAFDYCYVNYEPVSLVSDDDIEVIEDGLNACTFKFKTQPNTSLLSITAKNIELEPSGEEYKDFTNICMDISDYTASCGCPAPAPTEYGLCLWEPADGANQIRPINNKNIIVKNAIFSESISFSQVLSEINSSGLITNLQTNLIINGYTTPILKGITTGISGKIILLTNTTNTAITIKNLEPTLSTERIETGTGSDYVMKDRESIWACWSINGHWMLINAHKLQLGDGVTITGAGTIADPFVATNTSLWQQKENELLNQLWLPSTGELQVIHDVLYTNGIDVFYGSTKKYWSSCDVDMLTAYYFDMINNTVGVEDKESDLVCGVIRCNKFTSTEILSLGELTNHGGYVFYIVNNGTDFTYWEAFKTDFYGIWHGTGPWFYTGTTSPAFGEGENNTNEILALDEYHFTLAYLVRSIPTTVDNSQIIEPKNEKLIETADIIDIDKYLKKDTTLQTADTPIGTSLFSFWKIGVGRVKIAWSDLLNTIRHNQLMGLSWLESGHTGTPNKIFGSGASGEAVEYDLTNLSRKRILMQNSKESNLIFVGADIKPILNATKLCCCTSTNTYIYVIDNIGGITLLATIATADSYYVKYIPSIDRFHVLSLTGGNIYSINAATNALDSTIPITTATQNTRNCFTYNGDYEYYSVSSLRLNQRNINTGVATENPSIDYSTIYGSCAFTHNSTNYIALSMYNVVRIYNESLILVSQVTLDDSYYGTVRYYNSKLYVSASYFGGGTIGDRLYIIDLTNIASPVISTNKLSCGKTLFFDSYFINETSIAINRGYMGILNIRDYDMSIIDTFPINAPTYGMFSDEGLMYDNINDLVIWILSGSSNPDYGKIMILKIK